MHADEERTNPGTPDSLKTLAKVAEDCAHMRGQLDYLVGALQRSEAAKLKMQGEVRDLRRRVDNAELRSSALASRLERAERTLARAGKANGA